MSTYDFFISYRRRASLPLAEEIARVLSADVPGYRVFFDKEELRFSRKWQDQINESMTSSRAVIVILGRCSFCDVCGKRHPDEDKFLHELRLARQGGREIIPISFRNFMKHELHRVPDDELRAYFGDKGPSAIIAEECFIKKDTGKLAEHVNEDDPATSSVVQIDDKKAADTIVKAMRERYGRSYEYLNSDYVKKQTTYLRSMIHDLFKSDATIDPGERREVEAHAIKHYLDYALVDQLIDEKTRSLGSSRSGTPASVKPATGKISEEPGLASARQVAIALTSKIGADTANRVKASLGTKHATGELSAQDVNALLKSLGLQVKGLDGWALTKDGGLHGAESVGRGARGEAIRMLRWRESVVDVLAKEVAQRARSAVRAPGEAPPNIDPFTTADTTAALARATCSARERADTGALAPSTASPQMTLEDEDDLYQTVGGFTVKRALAEDATAFIATVIGRSDAAVRRALGAAAPNTRIANLFDEMYDPEVIGALTAKAAITCGVICMIAEHLDLPRPEVKRRLKAVHGKTAVATVFANEWEPDDEVRRLRRMKPVALPADPKSETSSPPATGADNEEELALLRAEVVAAAADGVIEMMEHHHLRRRAVFLGLADDESEAIALVTRLIHEVSPGVRSEPDGAPVEGADAHTGGGYDAIGAMHARDVDDNTAWAIAELCGYDGTKGVRRRTNKSPDALVRDLFNERWGHPAVLGELTVARARAYELAAPLARLSGLSETEVRSRFDAVKHGKTLIRNIISLPNESANTTAAEGPAASEGFGKMVDSFVRSLPDAQRRVADWFLAAVASHGLTPKKPQGRNAIALYEWPATDLVFSDEIVTFAPGYDADDALELAHHIAAMRAVPGAERFLLGPGQARPAPTFRVEIGDAEALDFARLVFEAIAAAEADDDRKAEG